MPPPMEIGQCDFGNESQYSSCGSDQCSCLEDIGEQCEEVSMIGKRAKTKEAKDANRWI